MGVLCKKPSSVLQFPFLSKDLSSPSTPSGPIIPRPHVLKLTDLPALFCSERSMQQASKRATNPPLNFTSRFPMPIPAGATPYAYPTPQPWATEATTLPTTPPPPPPPPPPQPPAAAAAAAPPQQAAYCHTQRSSSSGTWLCLLKSIKSWLNLP